MVENELKNQTPGLRCVDNVPIPRKTSAVTTFNYDTAVINGYFVQLALLVRIFQFKFNSVYYSNYF